MQRETFDIVIAGAGLAGLTLAWQITRRGFFDGMSVCVIDRVEKRGNDRTWCFWSAPDEFRPPVFKKSWQSLFFSNSRMEKTFPIAPYTYYMVQSEEYYRYVYDRLLEAPHVHLRFGEITEMDSAEGVVRTPTGEYAGKWVFNSAFLPGDLGGAHMPGLFASPFSSLGRPSATRGYHYMLQHFKGWVVRTRPGVFQADMATFMDFRIPQEGETRFVYVLPFNDREALVEFTVFSPDLLAAAAYDRQVGEYLENMLGITDFEILETEFGIIPMTDYPFPVQTGKVIHIGTAGGFVKASSGYAFKRTQEKIAALLDDWTDRGRPNPAVTRSHWRFVLYDAILLRVLVSGKFGGAEIFGRLFGRLPAQTVLSFLDEKTRFWQELNLMSKVPIATFSRAAVLEIWRRWFG